MLLINFYLQISSIQVTWTGWKSDVPTILTLGLTTYSADDRFFVEHARHLQNWSLFIKHVQPTDAGLYECQVSTHPPTSSFIKLKVKGELVVFMKTKIVPKHNLCPFPAN